MHASNGVVAIESKLTEHLADSPGAEFDSKYDTVISTLDQPWQDVYGQLKQDPRRYRFLNAAQLVKHAIGLRRYAGSSPVTLMYLYWEPSNGETLPTVRDHRAEVEQFRSLLDGSSAVRLVPVAAPSIWERWLNDPGRRVQDHAAALRARYQLAV
jgi:hypothetical protein